MKNNCKNHPKYKAIFPPRSNCVACKHIYDDNIKLKERKYIAKAIKERSEDDNYYEWAPVVRFILEELD